MGDYPELDFIWSCRRKLFIAMVLGQIEAFFHENTNHMHYASVPVLAADYEYEVAAKIKLHSRDRSNFVQVVSIERDISANKK